MSDNPKMSLAALSNADYKRDLAELAREIEQKDIEASERRKMNSFGAALHRRLRRDGKAILRKTRDDSKPL